MDAKSRDHLRTPLSQRTIVSDGPATEVQSRFVVVHMLASASLSSGGKKKKTVGIVKQVKLDPQCLVCGSDPVHARETSCTRVFFSWWQRSIHLHRAASNTQSPVYLGLSSSRRTHAHTHTQPTLTRQMVVPPLPKRRDTCTRAQTHTHILTAVRTYK